MLKLKRMSYKNTPKRRTRHANFNASNATMREHQQTRQEGRKGSTQCFGSGSKLDPYSAQVKIQKLNILEAKRVRLKTTIHHSGTQITNIFCSCHLPLFSDGFKEICFPLKLFRYRYLFNISFRVQIGLKFRIRIQIQWIWILNTGSKGGFCSERKVRKENRLARCGSMDIVKVSIPLSCLPPLPLLPGALLLFPRQRLLGRKITIIRNYKSLLRIRISKDPK